ncbi:MAG: ribonuclease HII [Opitutales bacterium]|nr:ribonuclease HII [Opitutales bacterium]
MNLFGFDKRYFGKSGSDGLAGVDEAGRGCFAGPVVAACVWLKRSFFEKSTPVKRAAFINDSKQLGAETREEVFALIRHWEEAGDLFFATGTASVIEIESFNILGATHLAMNRAIEGVLFKAGYTMENPPFAPAGTTDTPLFADKTLWVPILVDGLPLQPFAWQHEAIVGGDAKSLSVAMASIAAKVTRDSMMCDLAKKYPQYAFEKNKGYGTPEHIKALREHGVCELHRLKFLHKLASNPELKIPGLSKVLGDSEPSQEEFEF